MHSLVYGNLSPIDWRKSISCSSKAAVTDLQTKVKARLCPKYKLMVRKSAHQSVVQTPDDGNPPQTTVHQEEEEDVSNRRQEREHHAVIWLLHLQFTEPLECLRMC